MWVHTEYPRLQNRVVVMTVTVVVHAIGPRTPGWVDQTMTVVVVGSHSRPPDSWSGGFGRWWLRTHTVDLLTPDCDGRVTTVVTTDS